MEEGAEVGSAGGPAGAPGAGCCQRKEQGRGAGIVVAEEEVVVVAEAEEGPYIDWYGAGAGRRDGRPYGDTGIWYVMGPGRFG